MTANSKIIKRAGQPDADEHCSNCKFCQSWEATRWNPAQSPRVMHECRRFPPAFLPGEDCGSDYPGTDAHGWCGEWRAAG